VPDPKLIPPAAVLWDLDGTLVDTEPAWILAETELAARYDAPWTEEDAAALVGSALPHAAATLQARGVPLENHAIIEFLLERVLQSVAIEVPWQPGARALLEQLGEAAIPCALVTMSYRVLADEILRSAPPGVFGVSVTGDEVTEGKPHPEAYLKAAALLGVDIARCVAVEDSPTGLASAEASGARVIGVEHIVAVAAAPGRSRLSTLVGLSLDDLARIAGGEPLDRLGS